MDPRAAKLAAASRRSASSSLAPAPQGAAASGYSVTTYAWGFPNDFVPVGGQPLRKVGPIGLAFDDDANLIVGDYINNAIYRIPPGGGPAGVPLRADLPWGGSGGYVMRNHRLYVLLRHDGVTDLVELDVQTAQTLRKLATFKYDAAGIALDPTSGDLFVTSAVHGAGILRVQGVETASPTIVMYADDGLWGLDGIAIAADQTMFVARFTAYVVEVTRVNGQLVSRILLDGMPADGTAVTVGTTANSGQLFVNRNDGIITRYDLATAVRTDIYSGGSRGDFVVVGPDGCLYATQSDVVLRVTSADGTCNLQPSAGDQTVKLTLSPDATTRRAILDSQNLTVTALSDGGRPIPNLPLTLRVTSGPEAGKVLAGTTSSAGTASFTLSAATLGTDVASASWGAVTSNEALVTWVTPPPCPPTGTAAQNRGTR